MKYIITIAIAVFVSSTILAQHNYIPVSPEVEGFKAQASINTNGYNGNQGTTIPLLSIDAPGISVPILASYNSNGIKVATESSWIGLGWNLNYGGVVTKEVVDKDDLSFTDKDQKVKGGFLTQVLRNPSFTDKFPHPDYIMNPIENNIDDYSVLKGSRLNRYYNPYDGNDGNEHIIHGFCRRDTVDFQSDIYTFTFPTGQGKFVVNKLGEFVPLSNHNYKVEYIEDTQSWVITDNMGIRYQFGSTETAKQRLYSKSYEFIADNEYSNLHLPLAGYNPTEQQSISSWYLEEIKSPEGGVIKYIYEKTPKSLTPIPNFSQIITKNIGSLNTTFAGYPTFIISPKKAAMTNQTLDKVIIKEINNQLNDKILFTVREGVRLDVKFGERLKSITKHSNDIEKNTILFDNTEYFVSDQISDINRWEGLLPTYQSEAYLYSGRIQENNLKRLKLDGIKVCSTDEDCLPPYLFQYNETQLPPKTSFSIDFWGFSNGNASSGITNESYLPAGRIIQGINGEYCGMASFDYADKSSSELHSSASILKKITNPYGGSTEFEYELNEIEEETLAKYYTHELSEDDNFTSVIRGDELLEESVLLIDDFTVHGALQCQNIFFIEGDIIIGTQSLCGSYGGMLTFVDNMNGNEFTFYPYGNEDLTVQPNIQSKQIGIAPAGNYSVYHTFDACALSPNDGSQVELQITVKSMQDQILDTGAGLRIKYKITNDGLGKKSKHEYTYPKGLLFGLPTFISGGLLTGLFDSQYAEPTMAVSSNSTIPLTNSFNSYLVGYDYIHSTTTDLTTNSSYQSETSFYNGRSILDNSWKFGYLGFPRFNSSRNGLIKSHKEYNSSGDIVKETINTYEVNNAIFDKVWYTSIHHELKLFVPLSSIYNPSTVIPNGCAGSTNIDLYGNPEFFLFKVGYQPEWHQLKSTETKVYGTIASDPITTLATNIYNNTNYGISSTTVSNDGVDKTYEYKYPHDLNSSYLLFRNILNRPLETRINNGSGGGEKIEYSKIGNNVLPTKMYQATDSDWKLMTTLFYDDVVDSYPDRIKNRSSNLEENLTWGTGINLGILIKRTYGAREWDYTYYANKNLEKIEDYNAIDIQYEYDGLQRLSKSVTSNSRITTDYLYNISLGLGGVNEITTTPTYSDGTQSITQKTTFDGFGKSLQTTSIQSTQGGSNFTVSSEYDGLGRMISSNNPSEGGLTTYVNEDSSLGRLLSTQPAGSPKNINFEYFTNNEAILSYPIGTLNGSKSINENGQESVEYKDIFGRVIQSIQDASGLNLKTSYTYNDRDQILTINPPGNGTPYVYTYYDDGLLHTKTIPDQGTYTYTYNAQDQLWTESRPNGANIEYLYHPVYNDFLETVKLGGAEVQSFTMDGISGWPAEEVHHTLNAGSSSVGGSSTVIKYDSYDDIGRVEKETRIFAETSGQSIFDYRYDDANNIINIIRDHTGLGSTNYQLDYNIDKGIRQIGSEMTYTGLGSFKISELNYDNNEWLQTKELNGGMQSIDYGYNPRGWLTSINSVESTIPGFEPCEDDVPLCDCLGPYEVHNVEILYNCLSFTIGASSNIQVNINSSQVANGTTSLIDQVSVVIPINGGSTTPLDNYTNTESIQISNTGTIGNTLGNSGNGSNNGGGLEPGPTSSVDLLIKRILGCLDIAGAEVDPSDLQVLQMIENTILDALNLDINGNLQTSSAVTATSLFGMELHYFDGNPTLNAPDQFNGNISWVEWAAYKEPVQRYGYQYDGANRLLGAKYEAEKIETCEKIFEGVFDVTINGYDPRGNILGISRFGITEIEDQVPTFGLIDDLTYNYTSPTSNLLRSINESVNNVNYGLLSSSNYDYTNGNMTNDSGKGLGTKYNYLDLPAEMTTGDGNIISVYDASGRKIKQTTTENGEVTEYRYLDGIEVKNGRLEAVYHDEGRVVNDLENGRVYNEFYLKDHLGNVRVRLADKDNNGTLDIDPLEVESLDSQGTPVTKIEYQEYLGSNSYYPFGMKFSHNLVFGEEDAYWVDYQGEIDNKYTYNGKEEVGKKLGINLQEYGARMYDPAVARFTTIDRFSEKYSFQSGYTYAANNPIKYIDVNGDSIRINNVTYLPGSTYDGDDQFVSSVFTALNYLIDNDADVGGVISDVASNETTINILENTPENNPNNPRDKSHFNNNVDNKNVKQGDPFIIFDQNNGIEFDEYSHWIMQSIFGGTGTRSPAEVLLHELGHAQHFLNDPVKHKKYSKNPYAGYTNAEEYRVIQSVENPAALKLGGMKRNHHSGRFKKVSCVTCNN